MKQVIDQGMHGLVALLALVPAMLWPNPITAGLGGFIIGALAEVKEEGAHTSFMKVLAVVKSKGNWADLAGYTLPSMIAGGYIFFS